MPAPTSDVSASRAKARAGCAEIEKYQTTSHVPEALHRLVECYLSLGVKKEAQTAAAVLGYNYPGSDWYEDSYNLLVENKVEVTQKPDEKSWISKAWSSAF